ncbi:MAG TPA: hypothetical protein P5295_15485 [Spirochaetota bacterium]|nr:hypothetical protein [Spirochaetota bacterium]
MKCSRCGKEITPMSHFYIPGGRNGQGVRYCIACAREEKIVTLV